MPPDRPTTMCRPARSLLLDVSSPGDARSCEVDAGTVAMVDGVDSGVRAAAEQRVDQVARLCAAPIEIAQHGRDRTAEAIDEDGGWKDPWRPFARRVAVGVEEDGGSIRRPLQEAADHRRRFAIVDGENHQAAAALLPCQRIERRDLGATRLAPGRPEVEEDDLAC